MNEPTLPEILQGIQTEWGMTDGQMAALCHVDERGYATWMIDGLKLAREANCGSVPRGMDNAVPVVSIFKRLRAKFPHVEDQVKWLFKEHADFGGNKPIDVAASSVENLNWISYYLDTSRDAKSAQ